MHKRALTQVIDLDYSENDIEEVTSSLIRTPLNSTT